MNGALLWEVVLPENASLPYGGTMAPLVVGDLVIAGVGRRFRDPRVYRGVPRRYRYTGLAVLDHPARGEPGSETWKGDLDLETGGGFNVADGHLRSGDRSTLFWPTGNPYPDTDGSERLGDNLYTNSILALDAKTGRLRWHYQFTPHDLWDWDAQEPPVSDRRVLSGAGRKLLLQANRNGFFYVLDHTDGKVLLAKPFVQKLTWASGIGPDDGRNCFPEIFRM